MKQRKHQPFYYLVSRFPLFCPPFTLFYYGFYRRKAVSQSFYRYIVVLRCYLRLRNRKVPFPFLRVHEPCRKRVVFWIIRRHTSSRFLLFLKSNASARISSSYSLQTFNASLITFSSPFFLHRWRNAIGILPRRTKKITEKQVFFRRFRSNPWDLRHILLMAGGNDRSTRN